MDTNAVVTILRSILEGQQSPPSGQSAWIVAMIIGALAPTLASIAAYFKAKAAADDTKQIKESAALTATSVEKAHIAINSERADSLAERKAMLDELRKVREEILVLSKQKATLEEHQRSTQAGERSIVTAAPVEPARMSDTQLFKLVKELGNELDLRRLGKGKTT